jgi:hypothetical protein
MTDGDPMNVRHEQIVTNTAELLKVALDRQSESALQTLITAFKEISLRKADHAHEEKMKAWEFVERELQDMRYRRDMLAHQRMSWRYRTWLSRALSTKEEREQALERAKGQANKEIASELLESRRIRDDRLTSAVLKEDQADVFQHQAFTAAMIMIIERTGSKVPVESRDAIKEFLLRGGEANVQPAGDDEER